MILSVSQETTIKYHIPKVGIVTVKIYNLLGQAVKTLVNENKKVGYYQVIWNSKNDFGFDVSSGINIYRLESGDYIKSMKMMLLK